MVQRGRVHNCLHCRSAESVVQSGRVHRCLHCRLAIAILAQAILAQAILAKAMGAMLVWVRRAVAVSCMDEPEPLLVLRCRVGRPHRQNVKKHKGNLNFFLLSSHFQYPFRSFSEESAWQVAGCCCLRFGLAAALLPRPAGRHPKPFWFPVASPSPFFFFSFS